MEYLALFFIIASWQVILMMILTEPSKQTGYFFLSRALSLSGLCCIAVGCDFFLHSTSLCFSYVEHFLWYISYNLIICNISPHQQRQPKATLFQGKSDLNFFTGQMY